VATKITKALIDDLEGGKASKRVEFSFDGVDYEIDLNAKNDKNFRDALEPYIRHARIRQSSGSQSISVRTLIVRAILDLHRDDPGSLYRSHIIEKAGVSFNAFEVVINPLLNQGLIERIQSQGDPRYAVTTWGESKLKMLR